MIICFQLINTWNVEIISWDRGESNRLYVLEMERTGVEGVRAEGVVMFYILLGRFDLTIRI